MPQVSLAAIITSLHGHSGKTLLARVMVDYFVLSGQKPYIFDTDPIERGLYRLFPADTSVLDLAFVPHQMTLFDTLARDSPLSRIVDLTHRSFGLFFDLMRQTDFVSEARARGIEPVIFYIPDRKRDSFEAGFALRERFPDCSFVVVDNGSLGEPRGNTRTSDVYRALAAHPLHIAIPRLDRAIAEALEEPSLALSDFMQRPMTNAELRRLPSDLIRARMQLRTWLIAMFKEIYRITHLIAERAEPPLPSPTYS
jgi:hypothetical protein